MRVRSSMLITLGGHVRIGVSRNRSLSALASSSRPAARATFAATMRTIETTKGVTISYSIPSIARALSRSASPSSPSSRWASAASVCPCR